MIDSVSHKRPSLLKKRTAHLRGLFKHRLSRQAHNAVETKTKAHKRGPEKSSKLYLLKTMEG